MATEMQVAANRRNARRSTGPRSRAGKQRVSHNAIRHGLSISVTAHGAESERVEELARAIAGASKEKTKLELSRTVAAAELDLARARQAKVSLIERIKRFGTFDPAPRLNHKKVARAFCAMFAGRTPVSPFEPPVPAMPSGVLDRSTEAIKRALLELMKVDRYEQRARVRRDRAIFHLMMINS